MTRGYIRFEIVSPVKNDLRVKKWSEQLPDFKKYKTILFGNNKKSEMVERIKSCLFWFGKAQSQIDITQKFLFCCIALEALLSPNDTKKVIATITESAAFVLYNKLEDRLDLIAKLRKIYSQRSMIVHRGINTASKKNAFYYLEKFSSNDRSR